MVKQRYFRWLVFFCFVMFAWACNNTIEPLDRENGIFAIYGFLDLKENNHYIRVKDLHAPFTKAATETIDATVTLHNLTLGTATLLESERRAHEDIYQHNFIYSDSVYADHKYKLSIERSDGVIIDVTTLTPSMPEPIAEPLNQNCYVPIEFSMGSLNGGTVELRLGLGPSANHWWGRPHILQPDDSENPTQVTFTFTPHDAMINILPFTNPSARCSQYLNTGSIYISYIHYSPGFFERIANDSFDIFESTQKFGALYFDTLAVPVDTSPVCPQDC